MRQEMREGRQPLEGTKGKEMNSALEPTGGTQLCQPHDLNSVKYLFQTSDLQNCQIKCVLLEAIVCGNFLCY
jgi:hypothetical protein